MKPITVAILGGIGAGLALTLINKAAATGVKVLQTVGDAVDPTNPDNIAASGINKVGGILVTEPDGNGKSADGSWSLGAWAYDVLHPEETAQIRAINDPVEMTRPKSTGWW